MAQPTTSHSSDAPKQAATYGVGMQGDAPKAVDAPPAAPVLFEDIDPVLLVRLYPGAKDAADMRSQATAAGKAAQEAGAAATASQNEPVVGAGDIPSAPPPAPAPKPTGATGATGATGTTGTAAHPQ